MKGHGIEKGRISQRKRTESKWKWNKTGTTDTFSAKALLELKWDGFGLLFVMIPNYEIVGGMDQQKGIDQCVCIIIAKPLLL